MSTRTNRGFPADPIIAYEKRRLGSLPFALALGCCDIGEARAENGNAYLITWGLNLPPDRARWMVDNTEYHPIWIGTGRQPKPDQAYLDNNTHGTGGCTPSRYELILCSSDPKTATVVTVTNDGRPMARDIKNPLVEWLNIGLSLVGPSWERCDQNAPIVLDRL